jgi:hypothetical protein
MRARGARAPARARAITTQSFTAIICAGAAGCVFLHNLHAKLLQHKLIRVQCTKKTPEYRYPLYRSTGIWFKQIILN